MTRLVPRLASLMLLLVAALLFSGCAGTPSASTSAPATDSASAPSTTVATTPTPGATTSTDSAPLAAAARTGGRRLESRIHDRRLRPRGVREGVGRAPRSLERAQRRPMDFNPLTMPALFTEAGSFRL